MRRLIRRSVFVLVACALSGVAFADNPRFGEASPRPREPGVIRVATYNALNLFDERDDPSLSGDEDDMKSVKPESERRAVAAAIRAIDADVLALQEIESYDALIEFREQYLKDMGYEYVVSIDVHAERGIEQAVLSRFPVTEAVVWPVMPLGGTHPATVNGRANTFAGKPIVGRRSPLRVTVEAPAERSGGKPYAMTLFVVHHKSGRGNEYWREAESAKFLEMVRTLEAQDPERNIAVLGDFNAVPGDASVEAYRRAGMSDVFESRDTADSRQITHESGRVIDMILVNEKMRGELLPGSAFVLGTPLRPAGADWRTTPPPAGFASDHLPVVADFDPRRN